MREGLLLTCVLGLLTVFFPWTSSAQTPDSLDLLTQRIDSLRLVLLEDTPLRRIYLTEAGTAVNTPNAFGGSRGSLGAGMGVHRTRSFSDSTLKGLDGVAGLSIGLGNPRRWVGVAVGFAMLDISEFKRASASLKVTRVLIHHPSKALTNLSVAAGVQNIKLWGDSDAPRKSLYGVASAKLKLKDWSSDPFSRLYFSVGIGNGRFSIKPDIDPDSLSSNKDVDLFFNVAIKTLAPLNLFAEWTGQEFVVGTSVTPFHNIPFAVTFALADVTGRVGQGVRPILAVGFGIPLQNINL